MTVFLAALVEFYPLRHKFLSICAPRSRTSLNFFIANANTSSSQPKVKEYRVQGVFLVLFKIQVFGVICSCKNTCCKNCNWKLLISNEEIIINKQCHCKNQDLQGVPSILIQCQILIGCSRFKNWIKRKFWIKDSNIDERKYPVLFYPPCALCKTPSGCSHNKI